MLCNVHNPWIMHVYRRNSFTRAITVKYTMHNALPLTCMIPRLYEVLFTDTFMHRQWTYTSKFRLFTIPLENLAYISRHPTMDWYHWNFLWLKSMQYITVTSHECMLYLIIVISTGSSTACSEWQQRKHQSSPLLAFPEGINHYRNQ